jgi:hypothetical protein
MVEWSSVREYYSKYGPVSNPEAFSKMLYIRNVYNTAGLLLMEKEADPELVFQLYSPHTIIRFWEAFKPVIMEARRGYNHSTYYKPLEHLYEEARRLYPEILSREQNDMESTTSDEKVR